MIFFSSPPLPFPFPFLPLSIPFPQTSSPFSSLFLSFSLPPLPFPSPLPLLPSTARLSVVLLENLLELWLTRVRQDSFHPDLSGASSLQRLLLVAKLLLPSLRRMHPSGSRAESEILELEMIFGQRDLPPPPPSPPPPGKVPRRKEGGRRRDHQNEGDEDFRHGNENDDENVVGNDEDNEGSDHYIGDVGNDGNVGIDGRNDDEANAEADISPQPADQDGHESEDDEDFQSQSPPFLEIPDELQEKAMQVNSIFLPQRFFFSAPQFYA